MGTFEGYGAGATGGSTSQVVTNLNDSGSGSLRAALATSTPSITFAVEGWIFLESTLSIPANTTINGTSAPGNGITLSIRKDLITTPWHVARIEGSNVIFRGIRLRGWIPDAGHKSGDALNMQLASGVSTIMVDQCSMGWGDDENVDIGGCTDVTVQWSIIHQGLQTPGTSLGFLIPSGSANRISVHHNLMALSDGRCLGRNASNGIAEFVCNICYAPGDHPSTVDNSSSTDFIKNYYKKGPNSNRNYLVHGPSAAATIYHGNSNACNNCTGFTQVSAGTTATISGTPLASPGTPVTQEASAVAAAAAVIASAGCYASDGNLDTFDQQVIDQYNLGVGEFVNDPEVDIGGVCHLPY